MEPSSPLASHFSCKSWWLVTKGQNDGYAETYGTWFKDHTPVPIIVIVLACCSLATRMNSSSYLVPVCTVSGRVYNIMVMIYYYAMCAVYCIISFVHEGGS